MEPLLHASLAIQIHVIAAVAAIVLGATIFFRRKGTGAHRRAGQLWVLLMFVVCFSSFAIHELRVWGPWSPIHILSVATPVFLVQAIYLARNGQIRSHKLTMISTYLGALVIAGAFSFMPGRIMHDVAANGVGGAVTLLNALPPFAWLLIAGLPLVALWRRRRGVGNQ
ncbi:MAG: DUF2306 domain-containing protein [Pseudomonadota bacterium]